VYLFAEDAQIRVVTNPEDLRRRLDKFGEIKNSNAFSGFGSINQLAQCIVFFSLACLCASYSW
jgi:hypothetical protein